MRSALTILIALITISTISSCKKDEKANSLIVGKWFFEKIDYVEFEDGQKTTSTETGGPGDFFQFDADGKFSGSTWSNKIEVSTWELINNKMLKVKPNSEIDWPEAGMEIKTLTSSSLVLYEKTIEGNNYYETTVYLKK
ncbi:hypothetical protein HDC92_003102 [Pedobacter sp. AK017]|uniref:hypothetical protein n=1 Tax=Pedobacter sp. AK017 TaxID=2723073 RepID=UPI00160C7ECC|nr:hypothetical protein [Pedobacter sp. AK017]MBB5439409.1 hypothetical protein [Pedobacter sp. AK017]